MDDIFIKTVYADRRDICWHHTKQNKINARTSRRLERSPWVREYPDLKHTLQRNWHRTYAFKFMERVTSSTKMNRWKKETSQNLWNSGWIHYCSLYYSDWKLDVHEGTRQENEKITSAVKNELPSLGRWKSRKQTRTTVVSTRTCTIPDMNHKISSKYNGYDHWVYVRDKSTDTQTTIIMITRGRKYDLRHYSKTMFSKSMKRPGNFIRRHISEDRLSLIITRARPRMICFTYLSVHLANSSDTVHDPFIRWKKFQDRGETVNIIKFWLNKFIMDVD